MAVAVTNWQTPIESAPPALVTSDEGICLCPQSGLEWMRTEIRGEDRLFIKLPDCVSYGGNLVEQHPRV
jgi:hypothetical protein